MGHCCVPEATKVVLLEKKAFSKNILESRSMVESKGSRNRNGSIITFEVIKVSKETSPGAHLFRTKANNELPVRGTLGVPG